MALRACVFTDEVSSDLEEAVRLSVEAGAEGLELRGKLFGKSITQIDDAEVVRIREICERYGVRVAVVGSPIGKCDPDDPEECRRHQELFSRVVEVAHAFETPVIRGFALWRPGRDRATDHIRPNLEDYLDRIVRFLRPIAATAERSGVRFCLETEGATLVGTCAEAGRVIDALDGSRALGVTWDVNNGWSCGELPYPDGYAAIRGRVAHVHVKPNPEGSLATVADTSLTYEQVLRVLKEDGYDGWAGIEHWGSPQAMLQGLRELQPVLRRVNDAAAGSPTV